MSNTLIPSRIVVGCRHLVSILILRGNVSEPAPVMSIHIVDEKLFGMAVTLTRPRKVSKKEVLSGHVEEPPAAETEPDVSGKGTKLSVEG